MCALAAAVGAGGAAGRGDQAGVQYGGVTCGRSSPTLASQAAEPPGDSQSARSWQSKRARNARLIGESRAANRPTAPGNAILQVGARAGWHSATRWRDEVPAGAAGPAQA